MNHTNNDTDIAADIAADIYFVRAFALGCGLKLDATVYELERQMGQEHMAALAFAVGSTPFAQYTFHTETLTAQWDVDLLRAVFYDPLDGNKMIGYYHNRKYRCISPSHVKEILALLPPHTKPYTVGSV